MKPSDATGKAPDKFAKLRMSLPHAADTSCEDFKLQAMIISLSCSGFFIESSKLQGNTAPSKQIS
eukprot:4234303-Amphidinium_carterae.1